MEIESEIRQNIVLLRVTGEIDIYKAEKFKRALLDQIDHGNPRVAIDMSRVHYIDSACIGALIAIVSASRKLGGDVKLFAVQESIRYVIGLVKLDWMFPVYESEKDAIVSFANSVPG